jgi:hypothetical protein
MAIHQLMDFTAQKVHEQIRKLSVDIHAIFLLHGVVHGGHYP